MVAGSIIAQTVTQCYNWDAAFVSGFWIGIVFTFISVVTFGWFVHLLGRRYWWATRPISRVAIVSGVILGLALPMLVFLPQVSMGLIPYGEVSAEYLQCGTGGEFGAEGFFMGLIASGKKAHIQVPLMTLVVTLTVAIGASVVIGIYKLMQTRRGLYAKA